MFNVWDIRIYEFLGPTGIDIHERAEPEYFSAELPRLLLRPREKDKLTRFITRQDRARRLAPGETDDSPPADVGAVTMLEIDRHGRTAPGTESNGPPLVVEPSNSYGLAASTLPRT